MNQDYWIGIDSASTSTLTTYLTEEVPWHSVYSIMLARYDITANTCMHEIVSYDM